MILRPVPVVTGQDLQRDEMAGAGDGQAGFAEQ